jgi:hypothetical protein
MPEKQAGPFATFGNGPRYDHSAAAAAEIINLHFDPSEPKAIRFGRILFTVLEAMYRADEELRGNEHERYGNDTGPG